MQVPISDDCIVKACVRMIREDEALPWIIMFLTPAANNIEAMRYEDFYEALDATTGRPMRFHTKCVGAWLILSFNCFPGLLSRIACALRYCASFVYFCLSAVFYIFCM